MKLADCQDATGWQVIPDLSTLRREYVAAMGQARGNAALDRLPTCAWTCVYDMRREVRQGGLICTVDKARVRADLPLSGELISLEFCARHIHAVYPSRQKGV